MISTQWQAGMMGYTGLSYVSVYATIDREAKRRGWDDAFVADLEADIRVMERAALQAMSKK